NREGGKDGAMGFRIARSGKEYSHLNSSRAFWASSAFSGRCWRRPKLVSRGASKQMAFPQVLRNASIAVISGNRPGDLHLQTAALLLEIGAGMSDSFIKDLWARQTLQPRPQLQPADEALDVRHQLQEGRIQGNDAAIVSLDGQVPLRVGQEAGRGNGFRTSRALGKQAHVALVGAVHVDVGDLVPGHLYLDAGFDQADAFLAHLEAPAGIGKAYRDQTASQENKTAADQHEPEQNRLTGQAE